MTTFIKHTDHKNKTCIIEGEKMPKKVFSIKRFICEVQRQETEKETQEVADMLVLALTIINSL